MPITEEVWTAAGSEKALLGRSLKEVQQIAVAEGYPVYRGKQLYEGILQGAKSLADVSNVRCRLL